MCGAVQCHVVWSISTLSFSHPASQPSVWVGRQAEEHWIGYASWDGMGWDGKEKWTTFKAKEKEKRKKMRARKKKREEEKERRRGREEEMRRKEQASTIDGECQRLRRRLG
jgi:hypothetical protein